MSKADAQQLRDSAQRITAGEWTDSDLQAVARAVLALPADDETPAQLGIAYEHRTINTYERIEIRICGVCKIGAFLNRGGKEMFLCEVKTRGDVRRLCAALGVEVKEQASE
jgi:hypothetical protein